LIDTHCHLTHAKFDDDREQTIDRAAEAGLSACITIGTGVEDARRVGECIAAHAGFVFGTAGLDPFSSHRCGEHFDEALAQLRELFQQFPFCAVGEIGLDYHYDLDPKSVQRERFARQLQLADELNLPVVIHVREAHEDMAEVLADHPQVGGVIHSFTGGPKEAERYLELGWMLAFNGVMTFKNASEVRDAARLTPPERLLIETDSPYLAPMPLRGKRCEPAYVAHTLARLAEVRDEPLEALLETTSQNARRLFGLEPEAIIDR
jgi:TatD DNase family protein